LNIQILYRFEGQRQSIDQYGRQHGQDSQQKHEFKSLSVNPAEKQASKPAAAAADDDDVDLFGDEDEEESEQTKQRLAAYAEKKSKSKSKHSPPNILLFF
jgi:elongation factor 1-beta